MKLSPTFLGITNLNIVAVEIVFIYDDIFTIAITFAGAHSNPTQH